MHYNIFFKNKFLLLLKNTKLYNNFSKALLANCVNNTEEFIIENNLQ